MQEVADLYLQLGAAGFVFLLFGFMIFNLIQSQKEQSEDLESIKQSISKMEAEISNAQSISIKLVDRINSSDSKREDFWREISDDISFVKGRLNGRSN
jgi:Zn-dependent M32 family carboxypeptidase